MSIVVWFQPAGRIGLPAGSFSLSFSRLPKWAQLRPSPADRLHELHSTYLLQSSRARVAHRSRYAQCRLEQRGNYLEPRKLAIPNLVADAASADNAGCDSVQYKLSWPDVDLSEQVKCDQASPECGNCARLGFECTYDLGRQPGPRFNVRFQAIHGEDSAAAGEASSSSHTAPSSITVDESRDRRLLELRLLHHWMSVVSRPFMDRPAPRWGELWRIDLPLVAFRSDAVLHALLAMSSTHMLHTLPEDSADLKRCLVARNEYLDLALQEQRAALERIHVGNVDELSFAALLISLNAFSMLHERTLDPYEPPTSWLDMGRGAGSVMRQAAELVEERSGTLLSEIIRTTAPVHQNFEKQAADASALKPYAALLDVVDASSDDPDIQDTYRDAISHIATFRKAIRSGEPPYVHLRRICMFPFMVPARFTTLVHDQEPVALIILAHFFAVISRTEALQYLGTTGDDLTAARREVMAIHDSLPQQWHSIMIWPMDEVRAGD